VSPSDPSCACDCATDPRRETSWFRNHDAFRTVATAVLPALLHARRETKHLVLWAAACASGQEAYSLAILLDERLPVGWTAEILATDGCARMVERVRAGRYSQVEVNRGLQANALVKYFSRVGTEWQVAPQVREMVRAERVDLTDDLPALPDFDVVFLCSPVAHFGEESRRQVAGRVRDAVATDGYLVIGTAHADLDPVDGWEREPRGRTWVYRPAPTTGAELDPPHAPTVLMTGA
jgi:chemotaxis protein methyltransferase CheR